MQQEQQTKLHPEGWIMFCYDNLTWQSYCDLIHVNIYFLPLPVDLIYFLTEVIIKTDGFIIELRGKPITVVQMMRSVG